MISPMLFSRPELRDYKIIVVLQKIKMKITYRELREKLSDMAKIVPKSQKSTTTD